MFFKLRNPIRAIREPTGTAGLIVAVIALIAALGGAAFASGGLSSQAKKEIKKYAKLYAKQFAVPGAQGPQGPQGPPGAPGGPGKDGTNGVNGKSVVATHLEPGEGPTGEECKEGGTELEVEGSGAAEVVCNGEPGTFGSQALPEGQSLTGVWSFGEMATSVAAFVPISFQVPVEGGLNRAHVHFINSAGKEVVLSEAGELEEITSSQCQGSAESPTAQPGNLCMYAKVQANFNAYTNPNNFFEAPGSITAAGAEAIAGAAPVGAILTTLPTGANSRGSGTWAVRAPEAP
jgi:hypothetical protein